MPSKRHEEDLLALVGAIRMLHGEVLLSLLDEVVLIRPLNEFTARAFQILFHRLDSLSDRASYDTGYPRAMGTSACPCDPLARS